LKADLCSVHGEISDFVIDGSTILSIYGIRESNDIDYLSRKLLPKELSTKGLDSHDNQIEYHGKTKEELIYDPQNFFFFMGLKFISLRQVLKMKRIRGNRKDLRDCDNIDAFFYGDVWRLAMLRSIRKLDYLALRSAHFFALALKVVGIYDPVRRLYLRLKGRL
jgi:hypothetical protein